MNDVPVFLQSTGALGLAIAAHDWSASPLGPIDHWSAELRTAAALMLRAPLPMALLWGGDGVLLYNDHYAEIAGASHPYILGRPVRDAWPEAAAFNSKVLQTGLAGETLTFQRQEMTLYRSGVAEQVFFDLHYSPVPDALGVPAGVIAVVMEVTGTVNAEAELMAETRTLETLNRTGAALAAELDLEPLVQHVTDAGVQLTGAQFGAYFHNLMDETGERLLLFTLSGALRSDFERLGRPRATAVFGPTFRNEGVIRSDDILADHRYGRNAPHLGMPPGHLPVRSYLAVPVVSRSGAVLGGLLFGHSDTHRFSERHERLLVGIAAQAAIAIDNARLFATVQDNNATLELRIAERTEELTRAHDALHQAQKMETLGQLTGGIAHDFNNLLTVIRGSTDLLRRPGQSEARRERYVDAIAQTADRAAKLTGQLLAFARRSSLTPTVFDVGDTIRNLNELMETLSGEMIELDLRPAMTPCLANTDINQFETAIVNMAVNARDAMGQRGRLTITVAPADHIPPVRGDDARTGDFVAVSIADTGLGIAAEDIEHIFEPFFTSKAVGHGTGLGLSQVFGFAKQSGGDVTVLSVAGEGATFTLYLPRADALPVAEDVEENAEGDDAVRLRILVVEDNQEVGTFVCSALGALGHEIVFARHAEEALALFDTAHPPDLLFSDVMMPGMNGIELTQIIRSRSPNVPVLLTSGYSETLSREGTGGFDLLRKPYAIDSLKLAIRRAIGKRD